MKLLSQATVISTRQQLLSTYQPRRRLRVVREQSARYGGELQAAQRHLLTIVDARFPGLHTLAYQRIRSLQQVEALNAIAMQITNAPDELGARCILSFMPPF